MTPEEETLEKIKYVLSFGNDPQAIRLIEQYGHWKQEQTEQCAINGVVKSLPLIEGKTKSNIKNNIPKEKLASPPPPIKR